VRVYDASSVFIETQRNFWNTGAEKHFRQFENPNLQQDEYSGLLFRKLGGLQKLRVISHDQVLGQSHLLTVRYAN